MHKLMHKLMQNPRIRAYNALEPSNNLEPSSQPRCVTATTLNQPRCVTAEPHVLQCRKGATDSRQHRALALEVRHLQHRPSPTPTANAAG